MKKHSLENSKQKDIENNYNEIDDYRKGNKKIKKGSCWDLKASLFLQYN